MDRRLHTLIDVLAPDRKSLSRAVLAAAAALGISLAVAVAPAMADGRSAPRATVVAVLAEANQALILDKEKGEYVLVKAGERIQGFEVVSVSEDDVILSHPSRPGREWVLPRVAELVTPAGGAKAAGKPTGANNGAAPGGLINPYPTVSAATLPSVTAPGTSSSGLVDPYAVDSLGNGSWTTVLAPAGSRATGPEPASTPAASPSPADALTASGPPTKPSSSVATTVTKPTTKVGASGSTVVATDKTPAVARDEKMALVRAEFDAGLADFNRLGKEVSAELTSTGVLLESVAKGSFVHRLGLRSGDRIVSVADKRIRSIDDAAGAYAAIAARDNFKIVVERGGDTLTLHYRFVK